MPNDYPIKELIAGAERAIAAYQKKGVPAMVFFKATCPTCRERPMFAEPNMIYDEMECCSCGTTFPFERGNYALMAGAGVEQVVNGLSPIADSLQAAVAVHNGTVLRSPQKATAAPLHFEQHVEDLVAETLESAPELRASRQAASGYHAPMSTSGRPTRQYQEPYDDYLERLKRWQQAHAPDELGETPRPTPTRYVCRNCNREWPYDPELDEPKLYCPNCGEQVVAQEEG